MPPRRHRSLHHAAPTSRMSSSFNMEDDDPTPVVYMPSQGTVRLSAQNDTAGRSETSTTVAKQNTLPSTMSDRKVGAPSMDSPGTGATTSSTSRRTSAPVIRAPTRASMTTALAAAHTDQARTEALHRFESDKSANSSRASQTSLWRTWCRMHHEWHGTTIQPLPLTQSKIQSVAAMFKAGGYSSFANYASRAKAQHIASYEAHGVPWSEELATWIRDSTRSVERGVGPSRQSFPVDPQRVLDLGVLEEPVCSEGPIGPTDFIIVGAFFLTREIEIACAKSTHVEMDHMNMEVQWTLPVSKNDPRAIGASRTWGCTCAGDLTRVCPFHSMARHLIRLRAKTVELKKPFEVMPLFPTAAGEEITKVNSVKTIVEVMLACGVATTDSEGRPRYGGHSLRSGGADMLAKLGLETSKIELLARWNSPMLLHYIRLAPVKSLTEDYIGSKRAKVSAGSNSDANGQRGLQCVLERLAERLAKSETALEDWAAKVEELVARGDPFQHVCNLESGSWHTTRTHSAGCGGWTDCGWGYRTDQIHTSTELPNEVAANLICGKCLPATKLLAELV